MPSFDVFPPDSSNDTGALDGTVVHARALPPRAPAQWRGRRAAVALGSAALWLTACSSDKPFQPDLFSTAASPYSHNFNASHADACEAARRAMLSQGYTTTVSTADSVDADKGFQPSPETHIAVSFHVVCTGGEGSSGTSVLYVNAVQDNYGLKKSDTSASVGLSILGSVSLPIRSSSDSMVKISSQTIPPGVFYDRFFSLVDHYLKTVVRSTPVSDNDVPAEPLPPLPSPIPPTPVAVPIATGNPAPVEIGAVPSSPDQIQKLAPLPQPAAPSPASASQAMPSANAVTSMPVLPAVAPGTQNTAAPVAQTSAAPSSTFAPSTSAAASASASANAASASVAASAAASSGSASAAAPKAASVAAASAPASAQASTPASTPASATASTSPASTAAPATASTTVAASDAQASAASVTPPASSAVVSASPASQLGK